MESKDFLSETWLNGKYSIKGWSIEINTSLSYVYFENENDENESYYFQGDEADNVIDEINVIYNGKDNFTQSEAIAKWINTYL